MGCCHLTVVGHHDNGPRLYLKKKKKKKSRAATMMTLIILPIITTATTTTKNSRHHPYHCIIIILNAVSGVGTIITVVMCYYYSVESINRGLACAHIHSIARTQKILAFIPGDCRQQKHTQYTPTARTECDYLFAWIKKKNRRHTPPPPPPPKKKKSHPKRRTPEI